MENDTSYYGFHSPDDIIYLSAGHEHVERRHCRIERNPEQAPGYTVLFDETGDILKIFPGEMTDDQIWAALEMANQFYRWGHVEGQGQRRI